MPSNGKWRFSGKKLWISIFAAAIFLSPIALLFLPSHEPTYEGKPFSFWLDHLFATILNSGGGEWQMLPVSYKSSAEADAGRDRMSKVMGTASEAVHAIGQDCLPTLAARLRSKNSSWKMILQRWAVRWRLIKPFSFPAAEIKRGQALTALIDLGPRARGIAPELVILAKDRDPEIKAAARRALESVAPDELTKLKKK